MLAVGSVHGGLKMGIVLWTLVGIFLTLAWSTWSMSRSFFGKGRLRGIRECVQEMRKGMVVQLGYEDEKFPDDLQKALSVVDALLDRPPLNSRSDIDKIHPQLWTLGRTLAEACWLKGHDAGMRRRAPAEGKIRIDLSLVELLQLGSLANLGFQSMMPNARLLDIRRFSGKDDAVEATRALSRLEAALPKNHRPDLLRHADNRMQLIDNWWVRSSKRAIA
jgi:hypothetical protein